LVSDDAIAIPPAVPIARGHVTIVPRRHVQRFYGLDVQEQNAVWSLVGSVKAEIVRTLRISKFRVGFADDEPSGHALVHIVPIGLGDSPHLPGGIEWVKDDLV